MSTCATHKVSCRTRPPLTLRQLLDLHDPRDSCLRLLNQLAFNPAKAGADHGGTYHDFGGHLAANFERLQRRLRHGRHRFAPYTRRVIRTGGRERVVYLANWPDRIVERWLAEALNLALARWFSPHSYAYRPGKYGVDACQRRMARAARTARFVVRRDVTNCFYSIPQDRMLDAVDELVAPDDPLRDMLTQRVRFEHSEGIAAVGLPFGSPIACVLANLYLTPIDRAVASPDVTYFRYADDFLVLAGDLGPAAAAAARLDGAMAGLGLASKPSHAQQLTFLPDQAGFQAVRRFKFLGLEFTDAGDVRLSVEKQRKVVNLFKREFRLLKAKLKRTPPEGRLALVAGVAADVVNDRIRAAAIVDYYLKHVTDVVQLRQLDLRIAQQAVAAALGRPFRWRDFGRVSYRALRAAGLPSLVHRGRLHAQGRLKVSFLSVHNRLTVKRSHEAWRRRRQRIDQAALARKARRAALS